MMIVRSKFGLSRLQPGSTDHLRWLTYTGDLDSGTMATVSRGGVAWWLFNGRRTVTCVGTELFSTPSIARARLRRYAAAVEAGTLAVEPYCDRRGLYSFTLLHRGRPIAFAGRRYTYPAERNDAVRLVLRTLLEAMSEPVELLPDPLFPERSVPLWRSAGDSTPLE